MTDDQGHDEDTTPTNAVLLEAWADALASWQALLDDEPITPSDST